MKKYLIMLLLFGWIGVVWGQETETGKLIKLRSYTKHSKSDEYINAAPSDKDKIKEEKTKDVVNKRQILLEPGVIFRVTEKKDKSYNLVALPYTKGDKMEYYNDKIFNITDEEFQIKAIEYEPDDRLSIGILALPFKFRPQGDKSFESNFNMNSTLNVRLSQNRHWYWQIGAGIGGVDLNSNNTVSISAGEDIKANALGLLTGFMLQYKKVQAGLYIGLDYINNQKHYQWTNNGKPWFSIGIGYQLFDVGLSKSKNGQ